MAPIKIVEQDTDYTCALACLESFSHNQGLGLTQVSLLRNHASECFVGRMHGQLDISGALSPDEFRQLADKLGLTPRGFQDHRRDVVIGLLHSLMEDEAVVFFLGQYNKDPGQKHYVRFSRVLSEDTIEVMNPQRRAARLHTVTWKELVSWDYMGFRLKAPPNVM